MTAPPSLRRSFDVRPPVVHLERRDPADRFAGPVCGQRSLDGVTWARGNYTRDAARVTCKKCERHVSRKLAQPAAGATPC